MPDAAGNIKGTGWSRKGEAAWDRIFGDAAPQRPGYDANGFVDFEARMEMLDLFDDDVPHEPPHEDLDERADRDEAAGWGR